MSFPANNNNRFFLVGQNGPFYPNSTYHPAAPGSQHQFFLVDQSGPYAPNSTYHPAAPGPEHQFYLQSRVNGAMVRTIPNSTYHQAPAPMSPSPVFVRVTDHQPGSTSYAVNSCISISTWYSPSSTWYSPSTPSFFAPQPSSPYSIQYNADQAGATPYYNLGNNTDCSSPGFPGISPIAPTPRNIPLEEKSAAARKLDV